MSELPEDLVKALNEAGLAAFFAECTDAHRKEYLKWIGEAKRPESKKARIEKAMQMLARKRAEEIARVKKKSDT